MLHQTNSDQSFCYFGTQSILQRIHALTSQIDGVKKADDIEYIHRMRVASRRLRSALALFEDCFSRKRKATWQADIRRITKSLGAARDTDVQLDFLINFEKNITEKKYLPGIQRLILRLSQHREKIQADVIKSIDRFEKDDIAGDMEDTLRQMVVMARLNNVPEKSEVLYKKAYEHIALRLEDLISYESSIYDPNAITQLHSMRIAAKRLRYTLEIFEPLYGNAIKNHIKNVKDIQELLGDIHDCDVWISFLPVFIEEEKKRTLEYFGTVAPFRKLSVGLKFLQDERKTHREMRYKEFIKLWEQFVAQDVWGQLRMVLQDKVNQYANEHQKHNENPSSAAENIED